MTLHVVTTKHCKWDNDVINICVWRGQGKEPSFCNKSCMKKMYIFKKIFENTLQQLNLKGKQLTKNGELSEEVLKFMMYLTDYMNYGLRIDIVDQHMISIIEGRSNTIDFVFKEKIEFGKRLK